MKIVRIIGGLGNQMFQYAFYKKLKEKYSDVKCDINGYETYTLHTGFSLQKYFDVQLDFASYSEVNSLTSIYKKDFFSKVFRKIFKNKKSHIEEIDFDQSICDKRGSLYLDGYWQSDNYFGDLEALRKDFEFKNIPQLDDNISDSIQSSNSVSLHVRRGDYVGNSVYAQQGQEYYVNAMTKLSELVENPVFYVFSDNIKWAEETLLSGYKSQFSIVFYNKENGSEIDDLHKMSLCKHNIIANSSFSWWGAWLNSNLNKIVIYPRNWYTSKVSNLKHIEQMPEKWLNL
ncbi:alpha-1,2-fucosyltransferase [Flavobacterium algoritolerans]|jgi:hypothetical protein|uniref:Alpha-1,2-fucosyltransferase n=1 Tax=Flavobacterium algoritolerans TaxID=3041254 RepID=A0ABT6VBM9_9FLAO|nr:alpha-1,2-fucosyltransferase [Flavobacterium algoritolerans]MDI5895622.1 alpha-1,2-fucosyltransferase [Flavobacterium algoritolerans]